MTKLAVWFDIPVTDMARAVGFYERVTSQKLKRLPVGENKETALFESDGCLFLAPEDKPSHYGCRVYFNAESGVESDVSVEAHAAPMKLEIALLPYLSWSCSGTSCR